MKRDRPAGAKSSSKKTKQARISTQRASVHLINNTSPAPSGPQTSNPKPPTQSALKGGRLKAAVTATATATVSSPTKVPSSPPKAVPAPPPKLSQVIPAPTAVAQSPPNSIKIVFGTYEHLLYGLHLTFSSGNPTLTPLFHFRAHAAPLTTLAISPSGTHLATGSSTGSLSLWSLPRKRALGTLSPTPAGDDQQPGVSRAVFDPTGRLLAVADADQSGKLALYRTRDWALLRRLPGPMASLAFEPKRATLMFSVGRDRCLRLWDLSRQAKSTKRPVASVRLGVQAEAVEWSPAGDLFVVLTGAVATVYDTKMEPKFTFRSPRGRVHDAKFLISRTAEKTCHVLLACEDGIGRIFKLETDSEAEPVCVAELIGHSNRVRAIELVRLGEVTYVVTISSDGWCHVYGLDDDRAKWSEDGIIEPLVRYDSKGCRLTCLAVCGVSEKEKTEEEVIGNEGDEDLNLNSDSGSDSDSNSDHSG
ncbi:hypothetical protein CROQUDRAFT_43828 [Cronartium quercuum f. sp. fusiforme G11]|uniref:Uncharacterized protein n=1 Tax=Cronartium quercuum f. sp. fusiforme G11 TaxID=708437 RepID=A0A9P6TBZ3_9BASI|nr:hypothetical protein CROQUDRAFT_43828 [Cronartium quercuum f. sp. fusiforme G11]